MAEEPLDEAATTRVVRIGTRGSPLALWQADWVADRLRALHPGLVVERVEIRTRGDRDRNTLLTAMGGGTGIFTKEIQRALLDGEVDLAVHSLKDLPTSGPAELMLGAVPPREEAWDVLVAPRHRSLDQLPPGARVGTGSLRRRAQLLNLRPDLVVEPIRGNVETRLARAESGDLDAVVLAQAGLRRLGLLDRATEILAPPRFLPAVGQGALGVECRRDDHRTRSLLAALDDRETRAAVTAERRTLAELEGGCMIPLAAWGRMAAGRLALDVTVFSPNGQASVSSSLVGDLNDPVALGTAVAADLRARGAEWLLRPTDGSGSRESD